jgi:L-2,4-diaminobutyrate decarboxylase
MMDAAMAPAADSRTPGDDAEVLREHGHRLIDRMAALLADLEDGPVSPAPPECRDTRFDAPLPRRGAPAEDVWREVWDRVVGGAIHLAHPMYMGHQVAPPLPHAVLADALASLLNQSLAVREMSPSGTPVEAQVIRWLCEAVGYPAGADGTLVSGGSAANLTGLLAAREARFPGAWAGGLGSVPELARAVVLVSPHAHYSIERAAGVMGLGSDAVLTAPERDGRMDPGGLEEAIVAARVQGRVPLAVCATAGATATGAFDPLDAVADVCARQAVWLHVDGAHGASFALSPALRGLLNGIARADSISWDPHKMLWMPISAGAVLVRERRHLEAAFRQSAPYLFHDAGGDAPSPDAGRMTLQCSRRFDALKLWVCLRIYGADGLAEMMETTVRVTGALYARLEAADDFEPVHRPQANILCFRHLPAAVAGRADAEVDAFQAALRERYNASGEGWITATVLNGRRVLRVTLINPATGETHLDRLLAGLRRVGRGLVSRGG